MYTASRIHAPAQAGDSQFPIPYISIAEVIGVVATLFCSLAEENCMRQHHSRLKIAVLCVLALVALPLAGRSLDGPVTVTIIAQQPGTGPYGYATSVSKYLQAVLPEGSTINVVPRGGSMANPTTINMGKGDIGFAATSSMQWAYDGVESVYGKHGKHTNLRRISIGPMNINYTFIAARKDWVDKTGIDTFEKLINAKEMPRIAMKPPGSIVAPIFEEMFRLAGKDLEEYQKANKMIRVQPSQIGEMMRDGRVDVYLECVPPSHPSVTEIALTNDLVFIPIPLDLIEKMNHFGMFPTTMVKDSYRGVNADYPTTGTGNNFIAYSGADEEVVYLATKTIVENRDNFVEDNPQCRSWEPEKDLNVDAFTVPLHPGAERYYKERGWIK